MHLTTIILKDNRVFSSPIEKVRFDPDVFEYSYIKLFGYNDVFYFKDIESAVTENERDSKSYTGNVDEIKAMREKWELCRKSELEKIPLVEDKYRLPK